MQNVQLPICCNGVLAYVCKYIGKIGEHNFVVTKVDGDSGQLVNRYQHLHNTKVTISKINKDKARENDKDCKKPYGRAISLNEMVYDMLGYAEVNTYIKRIQVCTLPLKLRAGVDIKKL